MSEPFNLDKCGGASPPSVAFVGNAKSDAEYFVTTGVLSFLYSMAAAAVYLLAERSYQSNNILPCVVRTTIQTSRRNTCSYSHNMIISYDN
jgi:hypothetical protein